MASAAWGIDIGNRALKAVKLARTAEGVKMVDFAAIEHDTILSEAGDNREELVATALAKFASRHDTKKTPVAVSVTGQQSFARFVKLPPVEPKKRPEIVRFEAVQQIPFPLDEVEWSYQLFERADDPDVEVGIFAMRKDLVNNHVQQFVDNELDVTAVQTSPLAVYNAVRNDGRLDKGLAVILDLGAEHTDMIIADNDSIWMRSLDVGGNSFTEALAKAFKIDFEKAEEMKRGAKASKYAKQIYQAMRPVFGELVGEVQRSLGFYQSSHRDAEVRKIICLGGGFKLNGLSGYLQKNLQMPVEKPQRFNIGGPDESAAAAALAENTLSGTAAYGLALQGLGDAAITSSLLPTHIRQDKLWRDKTKYFVGAGAMCVAAAVIAFGSLMFRKEAYAKGEDERQEISRILSQAQELDTEWSTVATDGGAELQTVRNVTGLREGVNYWPMLAADLLSALPSPPPEFNQAMAGLLGNPDEVDEADREAITATPRRQRQFARLFSMESVYTDQLGKILDDPDKFIANAEQVLGGTGRNAMGAGGAGFGAAPGAAADPAMEGLAAPTDSRRGYIVRLVLVSPLSVDGSPNVYNVFDENGSRSLSAALKAIAPSPDRPDLPYEIVLADMSDVQKVSVSEDVVEELRLQAEAKAIAEAPAEANLTARPGLGGGGMGGMGGMGGYGADPYGGGDPYGGYGGDEYDSANMGGYGGGYPGGGYGGPSARPTRQPALGNRGAAGGRLGSRRANRPGRGGTAGAVDPEDPAMTDPVTGERVGDDSRITVLLAIRLDPPAYGEEEPDAAPEGDGSMEGMPEDPYGAEGMVSAN